MAETIAIGEVHIHVVPLTGSEAEIAALEACLSPDELSRANRFLLPDVRRRFIVCRGRLRGLLAAAVGIEPSAVRFRYGQWGKPELSRSPLPGLQFNVSHSGEWALIALAHAAVGVDLEVLGRPFQYRSIAGQVLTDAERPFFDRLPAPQRDKEILRLWVCKEALLKAMGLGIAEGLKQISFPIPLPSESPFSPLAIDANLQLHVEDDGSCRRVHWTDPQAWELHMLHIVDNSFAALAAPPAARSIILHRG